MRGKTGRDEPVLGSCGLFLYAQGTIKRGGPQISPGARDPEGTRVTEEVCVWRGRVDVNFRHCA